MKTERISLTTARRIAIHAQGLNAPETSADKDATARTIERLGYVQIDTISVVERAHHQTLWARQPNYDTTTLNALLAEDRRIFEYWSHAAAYLPMTDYRYYLPYMRRHTEKNQSREWVAENRELVDHVVGRIRDEGALGSSDFKSEEKGKSHWWGWKPAKHVMRHLFFTGDLMVSARRNFQCLYDLKERVLPSNLDTSEPTPDETTRFFAERNLSAFGILRAGRVQWGIKRGKPTESAQNELVDEGIACRVQVEGIDGTDFIVSADALEAASDGFDANRVHILSPFDNLMIERDRLEALFGFVYRLECYVPAPKRVHGYFVFPILWGDRFVGRLDPKADRKAKTLIVRKLMFEPDFTEFGDFLPAFAERLREFAAFNGCDTIVIEETDPKRVKREIQL